MLSKSQAKRHYDRYAVKQDGASYEDKPLKILLEQGHFSAAQTVFELGCGTGRFAEQVLGELPQDATYYGTDLSREMVTLTQARLVRFGRRAQVAQTDGSFPWPLADKSIDRVLSCYVLDLLPDDEITAVLTEAARVLRPSGRLCLANLTDGTTPLSHLNMWRWRVLYRLNPLWVGGCRPQKLAGRLDTRTWKLLCHETVVSRLMPSEIIVAERI